MKKKIFSILMSFMMLVSFMPSLTFTAFAETPAPTFTKVTDAGLEEGAEYLIVAQGDSTEAKDVDFCMTSDSTKGNSVNIYKEKSDNSFELASTFENKEKYILVAVDNGKHYALGGVDPYSIVEIASTSISGNLISLDNDNCVWTASVNSGKATLKCDGNNRYLAGGSSSLDTSSNSNNAKKYTYQDDIVYTSSGKTYYLRLTPATPAAPAKYYALDAEQVDGKCSCIELEDSSISGNTITLDDESCVWTASDVNNGIGQLINNNIPLHESSSSYKCDDAADDDVFEFDGTILKQGSNNVRYSPSSGAFKPGSSTDNGAVLYKKNGGTPVAPSVEKVELDKSSMTLVKGNSNKLTATVTVKGGADKTVNWSSNNQSVAKVANDGTVTAVATGTATITATSTVDDSKKAECTVQVVEDSVYELATSLEDGCTYLIVSAKSESSSAKAVANTSNAVSFVNATVSSSKKAFAEGAQEFVYKQLKDLDDEGKMKYRLTFMNGSDVYGLKNGDNNNVIFKKDDGTTPSLNSSTSDPYLKLSSSTVRYNNGNLVTGSTGDKLYLYKNTEKTPVIPPTPDVPEDNTSVDTLVFTSDAHNKSNASGKRANTWIPKVAENEDDMIEMFSTCGDNGDAGATGSSYWSEANDFLAAISDDSEYIKSNGVLIAGNHEWQNGSISSTTHNDHNVVYVVDDKSETNDADYDIFNFGVTASRSNGFTDADIANLDKYLASVDGSKPIFILSHFPLHDEGSRKNYSSKGADVIDTINKYSAGKTIVFLWGHTHTDSKSTEKNYDQIKNPGYEIGDSVLNFNYCAAGCMSDSDYNSASANVKGKGLVASVNTSTHAVTLKYYDKDANVLSSVGTVEAKKGESGSGEVTSVTLPETASVAEGSTVKIDATVAATGIGTDKSLTWSSNDTSVATVDSTGTVTGVSEGTATITAKSVNKPSISDTCVVTVSHIDLSITPTSNNSPSESKTIKVGEKLKVEVINGSDSEYTYSISFGTSDIASVDSTSAVMAGNGRKIFTFTGNKEGTTVITIKNNNSSYTRKATINLTVSNGGQDEPVDDVADDTSKDTLAFTSDIHKTSSNTSDTLLNTWLNNNAKAEKDKFEVVGSCGDAGPQSGNDYWTQVQKIYDVIDNNKNVKNGNKFFVCGNHDYSPGSYTHNKNDQTKQYKDAGECVIEDNYILYSLGAESDSEEYSTATRNALASFLSQHSTFDGPIFILAHYPLHCYGGNSGEDTGIHSGKAAKGSGEVINILNEYNNVVFLWGHNHSSVGSSWMGGSEDHYDNIVEPGEKINNTEINFTYSAAGCMKSDQNGISGRGMVASIQGDECKLALVNENATTVDSASIELGGESTTKHTITASAGNNGSISPSGEVSVSEGKSKTFTFTPNNGYLVDAVTVDGKAVTVTGNSYTFENVTSTHTINVTFKVNDSPDTIIVPTVDNPSYDVTVAKGSTVTLKVQNATEHENAHSFSASVKNSAIASVSPAESGSIAANEYAEFVVTGIAAGTTDITISGDKQEDSTYDRYATVHLTVTGGSTPAVPVESVTVAPKTLTLSIGNSVTLSATIAPNNADVKTVTWSSSDTGVAKVNAGTVSAVSAGTATITASAGGKSDTCVVTVQNSDPSPEDPKTLEEAKALFNDEINTFLAKHPEKADDDLLIAYIALGRSQSTPEQVMGVLNAVYTDFILPAERADSLKTISNITKNIGAVPEPTKSEILGIEQNINNAKSVDEIRAAYNSLEATKAIAIAELYVKAGKNAGASTKANIEAYALMINSKANSADIVAYKNLVIGNIPQGQDTCTHSYKTVTLTSAGNLKNGQTCEECKACHARRNYKTIAGWSTNYLKKLKVSKGKKSFTVKWKKQSKKNRKKFTGYQIRYSKNKNMSGAKYVKVKNSKSSKKISKLAKKTKYYVQVRTYKGGYYASWSGVKSVKTK